MWTKLRWVFLFYRPSVKKFISDIESAPATRMYASNWKCSTLNVRIDTDDATIFSSRSNLIVFRSHLYSPELWISDTYFTPLQINHWYVHSAQASPTKQTPINEREREREEKTKHPNWTDCVFSIKWTVARSKIHISTMKMNFLPLSLPFEWNNWKFSRLLCRVCWSKRKWRNRDCRKYMTEPMVANVKKSAPSEQKPCFDDMYKQCLMQRQCRNVHQQTTNTEYRNKITTSMNIEWNKQKKNLHRLAPFERYRETIQDI